MGLDLDLLAFGAKLATFFDTLNASKAFHVWVIMLTYLGLASAWVYYRNNASDERGERDDKEDDNGVVEDSTKGDTEKRSDEMDLAAIISLENEECFDEDFFEQISSSERSTQTECLGNLLHTEASDAESVCSEVNSCELSSFVVTPKDNDVDDSCRRRQLDKLKTNIHDVSEENHRLQDVSHDSKDSVQGEINQSKNVLNCDAQRQSGYFELNSSLSQSRDYHYERWSVDEKEIEVGFLSDACQAGDEINGSGNERSFYRGLPNVKEESISLNETSDKTDLRQIDQNTPADVELTSERLSDFEEDKGAIPKKINPSYVGENFIRRSSQSQDEKMFADSEEDNESFVDLHKSGGQVANFSRFDSMVESVEKYNFAHPPEAGNIIVNDGNDDIGSDHGLPRHEEIAEDVITACEAAPAQNEMLDFDNQKLNDLGYVQSKKFEDVTCGFADQKLDTLDSEDNITLNDKTDELKVTLKDTQSVKGAPLLVNVESERLVENTPVHATEDQLFEVEKSAGKQISRITNAAEIKRWIGLPGNVTDDENEVNDSSEKEGGETTDGLDDLSDGYSERYKGIADDFNELVEDGSVITDLHSEVPDCYSEICEERSEINELLEVEGQNIKDCIIYYEPSLQNNDISFEFNDGLSEVTDSFSEMGIDIGGEFKELPDNVSAITDIYKEYPDGYSETFDERSDVSDGNCDVREDEFVSSQPENKCLHSCDSDAEIEDCKHEGASDFCNQDLSEASPTEDYAQRSQHDEKQNNSYPEKIEDSGNGITRLCVGGWDPNDYLARDEDEVNEEIGNWLPEEPHEDHDDEVEYNEHHPKGYVVEEQCPSECIEESCAAEEYHAEDCSIPEILSNISEAEPCMDNECSEGLSESEDFATCSEYETTDIEKTVMDHDGNGNRLCISIDQLFESDSNTDCDSAKEPVNTDDVILEAVETNSEGTVSENEDFSSCAGYLTETEIENDVISNGSDENTNLEDNGDYSSERTDGITAENELGGGIGGNKMVEKTCEDEEIDLYSANTASDTDDSNKRMKEDYHEMEKSSEACYDGNNDIKEYACDLDAVDNETGLKGSQGGGETKADESDHSSETSESTGSVEEIDYELLVSSGEDSLENNNEHDLEVEVVESETNRRHSCSDVSPIGNVLKTIPEMEESCIENDESADNQIKDTAKEDNKSTDVMVKAKPAFNVKINWREIDLALSSYPKNVGFLRYFRNVLLSPGVFVDMFNKVPLQLHCLMDNGNRIAELYTEKLSSRSSFTVITSVRDSHHAKKDCKISDRISYSFNTSKKHLEVKTRFSVLPGCFGICYPDKAVHSRAKELTPIVCESLARQDVRSLDEEENNRVLTEPVHSAVKIVKQNEFESNDNNRINARAAWNCDRIVDDYVFETTLAAVERESFSGSSSSWASSDEYLEGEATTFIEVDEFETDTVSITDVKANQCSSNELNENLEKESIQSSLKNSQNSVSQPNFDLLFENNCDFYHPEYFDTFNKDDDNDLPDDAASRLEPSKLNFDILLSNSSCFVDVNGDAFDDSQVELFHGNSEKKPADFDTESQRIESETFGTENQNSPPTMGQGQSVGFTKGTLAMPVSNYSLRGITVKNQGEYAIINYKNTRFAPVITVDKRMEITLQVPQQQNDLPSGVKTESFQNSNLADKGSNQAATGSLNYEVFGNIMKQPVIPGDGVKKSELCIAHQVSLESLKCAPIETVTDDSSSFANHVDRIAEIAQKYCEIATTDKEGNLSDGKIDEESGITKEIYVNTEVEPIQLETTEVAEFFNETAEEQNEGPTDVCTTNHHFCTNTATCDGYDDQTVATNYRFADVIGNEQVSNTVEDIGDTIAQVTASSSDSCFDESVVTSSENDPRKDLHAEDAAGDSCFVYDGVTNPDIDNEIIQYVNNNAFEVAVIENGELSASYNKHENYISGDGDKDDRPQQVDFDGFQSETRIESFHTTDEVSRDNNVAIHQLSTIDLEETAEYNKARSKSLGSLPEGLFENMSWFYRNRPSSVCLDDNASIASERGSLRRTKSAEIARRKPKIRMSTNFERRPIKETNLDDLMKSLEYLGPRKGDNEKHELQCNEIGSNVKHGSNSNVVLKEDECELLAEIRKAKSTTMLVSRGVYGKRKESESVAKLVERFENPTCKTRKIIVETKRVYKQEPRLRNARSMDIDKNLKHFTIENKSMESADENNNNSTKQDHKDITSSNKSIVKSSEFGVYEMENQPCTTNSTEHVQMDWGLEQRQNTKTEFNDYKIKDLGSKTNELGSKDGIVEGKAHKVCNEKGKSAAINEIIKKLTDNATENQANLTHGFKDEILFRKNKQGVDEQVDEPLSSEQTLAVEEQEAKRTSIYGFSVFLTESHNYDGSDLDMKDGDENTSLSRNSKDQFWMQQKNLRGSEGNADCDDKVSDIDLILNTKFQASLESLDGLNDELPKSVCSCCGKDVKTNSKASCPSKCTDCEEKGILQKQKSHEKSGLRSPRSRHSFRKDRRLRKWLEERQLSMNSEDKALLDDMDAEDQSKLLRKVALSKGIDYKDRGDGDIDKRRYSSLHSRKFDFLEQLRYLINFEDDDYDEYIKKLKVNEKEQDAIELLREYETTRQLKKGKSPFASDDDGNDSDAFTDITDMTFSDYTRSRHSLNSLFLSQGSLYKSKSFDVEENYQNSFDNSFEKDASMHGEISETVGTNIQNFYNQEHFRFEPAVKDGIMTEKDGIVTEKDGIIKRNGGIEEILQPVVSVANVSHEPDMNESIEKMVAAEMFGMDDVNGLLSQASSAVRNRRGRGSRSSVPKPTSSSNLIVDDEGKRRASSLGRLEDMNRKHDDVFVDNLESGIVKNNVDIASQNVPVYNITRPKYPKEHHIYVDSPCSLLTERLNDASYENLRLKLVKIPTTPTSEKVPSPPPQRPVALDISSKSITPFDLPSPLIRMLKGSPQQRRRAASLREMSTEDQNSIPQNSHSFHSVPTSPPRHLRNSPLRKSTGSYERRRNECRSLPDLISKPEVVLDESPIKLSRYPSGGSSCLSLQKRSPRLQRASPRQTPVSSIRPPVRSPLRSPLLSEFEDEGADNETVFSDQTALLSDSSLDIGMPVDGYEIDDEDFFLPNSVRAGSFSPGFDDFLAHDSDGGSSGEFFVPLNTQSKRPESRIITCAFGPCKNRDLADWSQRSQFTSCVSCFTYYCSKECRKAHWKEHKLTCYYGRINYYTKALVRRFETNSHVNEYLSRLALEGFRENGRGCVLITFSSPMAAKFFLVSGTNVFVKDPAYATLNDVMGGGIVTKHQVLLQQTLQDYNPECEFVTNLTVFVGRQNQLSTSTKSRFNTSAILRCSKIPLNSVFLSSDFEPYPETSYDIKVFYLPRSKNHHFINDAEARRYYCREVSYGLRKYGVMLKRDYPEVYDQLCLYVEHNIEFVPITLYGQANGNNYKCVIFPEGFSGSSGTLELQGRGMLV